MDTTAIKTANAVGGRTARACDSCLIKRARWFCASDDAFLCQSCDSSVHSANQLASRHQRVRLQTSSFKANPSTNQTPSFKPEPNPSSVAAAASWHQGFTKKARSRRRTAKPPQNQPVPLVPEINGGDLAADESDEQIFGRVPVFDPFEDGFCTETDLADFAANVENLLGFETGEEYSPRIEEDRRVEMKVENDEDDDEVRAVIECQLNPKLDMDLNWGFEFDDCDESAIDGVGEEMKKIESVKEEKKMLLRLNYEEVIANWRRGSPWMDGVRPQFQHFDHFIMGMCLEGKKFDDTGRVARVWRYREKRRTRLFSKKIRYQVRKLNAEKRPRMKGRFVKRVN